MDSLKNRNTIELKDVLISIHHGSDKRKMEYSNETVYSAFQGRCYSIKIKEPMLKELTFIDIELKVMYIRLAMIIYLSYK